MRFKDIMETVIDLVNPKTVANGGNTVAPASKAEFKTAAEQAHEADIDRLIAMGREIEGQVASGHFDGVVGPFTGKTEEEILAIILAMPD